MVQGASAVEALGPRKSVLYDAPFGGSWTCDDHLTCWVTGEWLTFNLARISVAHTILPERREVLPAGSKLVFNLGHLHFWDLEQPPPYSEAPLTFAFVYVWVRSPDGVERLACTSTLFRASEEYAPQTCTTTGPEGIPSRLSIKFMDMYYGVQEASMKTNRLSITRWEE